MSKKDFRDAKRSLQMSGDLMERFGAEQMAKEQQQMAQQSQEMPPEEGAPQEGMPQEQPQEAPMEQEQPEEKGIVQGVVEAIKPMFDKLMETFAAKEEPKEMTIKQDAVIEPKKEEKEDKA